jgi:hypothetical protein
MADKIVSWGGIESKSTSGMSVTGSLEVSGSIRAKTTITFYGNSAQNSPGSITNDSSDNLIIASAQGQGKGTYLGVTNGSAVVVGSSNINFYTGNGIATHQMVVGYNSNNSIGNVGIGTSTPSAALTVKGTGATSSTTTLLVQNTNATNMLSLTDNGTLGINTFQTSSTAFTINRTNSSMGSSFNAATMGTLVSINDTVGNSNGSKTTVFINSTGASNNNAAEIYGGVGIGYAPYGANFYVGYNTAIYNTTRIQTTTAFPLTSRDSRGLIDTTAGGGISFWGDASGQGTGNSAYAGIRGLKANSTYINPLGNLAFYVQTGSSSHVITETTFREVARFNESGSFGIGTSFPSATLDVSGSGRFTSNVTITGSLTVSGSITATVPTTSSYVCDGILSGDQTFATGSDVTIAFVDYVDPNGWLTSNQFKPTIAGYYSVSFGVWLQNPGVASNQVNVQMRKNTNAMIISQQPLNNGTGISLGGSRIVQMNGTTDYLDWTVFQGTVGSGTTGTLLQGSANGSGTWFSAFLLTQ